MTNERNTEARIKYLTEELHRANMEINRLVLENQEQDFEIHKLKKQRDEFFERLVMKDFRECDYDNGEFLLKDYIDKDPEELHKAATAIIFGSPEDQEDKIDTLFGSVSPARYTAEKAQQMASALRKSLEAFNQGYTKGIHDKLAGE